MVKLGNKVKDVVSNFAGIAVRKVTFLNGCVQFEVKGPYSKKEGASPSTRVDIQQLLVLEKGLEDAVPKVNYKIDFSLGNTVVDLVSGFQGIAVAFIDDIDGTSAVNIREQLENPENPDVKSGFANLNLVQKVDDGVVKLLKEESTPEVVEEKKKTGGEYDNSFYPPKQKYDSYIENN